MGPFLISSAFAAGAGLGDSFLGDAGVGAGVAGSVGSAGGDPAASLGLESLPPIERGGRSLMNLTEKRRLKQDD